MISWTARKAIAQWEAFTKAAEIAASPDPPERCVYPVFWPYAFGVNVLTRPDHALVVGWAATSFHAQAAQRWLKHG